MIVLIALGMLLYVGYCFWIIELMSNKLPLDYRSLVASLFLTIMPAAVNGQILFTFGVIK